MLRDWNGESSQPIIEMLKQFGIKTDHISLVKYEALTPDSFMWIFAVGNESYCLYAEDYVPTLEHVVTEMKKGRSSWSPHDKYELLPVVKRQEWKDSGPVKTAGTNCRIGSTAFTC